MGQENTEGITSERFVQARYDDDIVLWPTRKRMFRTHACVNGAQGWLRSHGKATGRSSSGRGRRSEVRRGRWRGRDGHHLPSRSSTSRGGRIVEEVQQQVLFLRRGGGSWRRVVLKRLLDGLLQIGFFLIGIVRHLNGGNVLIAASTRRAVGVALRGEGGTGGTTTAAASAATAQTEPVHLGKGEEGLAVDVEVVLAESRASVHRWGGVGNDLEDVVALHGPAEFKHLRSADGEVDLLTVSEEQPLAGGDGPHESNIMLLSTAGSASFTIGEGILVREAEAPGEMNSNKNNNKKEQWWTMSSEINMHMICRRGYVEKRK